MSHPGPRRCLEKVNVKYVIKRLWHEIFHIVPRPISALQLRYRDWYGSLGLIPGPIWKMSCNNLLILSYYLVTYRHDHNGIWFNHLEKNWIRFRKKSTLQYIAKRNPFTKKETYLFTWLHRKCLIFLCYLLIFFLSLTLCK